MSAKATIGICITDESVTAVCVARNGSIKTKSTSKLKDGGVVAGIVQDEKALSSALKKVASKMKGSSVALCVPAQCVYTGVAHPADGKAPNNESIQSQAAIMFPENTEDIRIAFRTLSKDKHDIGIAAIRKDILAPYLAACKKIGLHVCSVTTAPAAIASVHATDSQLALIVTALSPSASYVTIADRTYPLDESVLRKGTDTSILSSVGSLLKEYAAQNHAIQHITALTSPTLADALEKKATPRKKADAEDAPTVNKLVQKDGEQAAVAAACAVQSNNPLFVFTSSGINRTVMIITSAVGAALLAGAGYWLYTK